jgi:hypothetical protein
LKAKDSEFTREKCLNADELMVFAETLYSLMIEDSTWGTHQNQEEQIGPLTSGIKLLKSQAASKKNNSEKTNKKNKCPSGDDKNTKDNNNKDDKKESQNGVCRLDASSGQAKTKTVNDKQYWWCPHHQDGKGQWVRHQPEDHKFKDDANKTKKGNDVRNTPKAGVAAAVAEFLERDE